jgi:membrane protein
MSTAQPPASAQPEPAAAPPPPGAGRSHVERRSLGSRISRVREAIFDFLGRVYTKAGEDNIFFMAGAIAFNVLVAFVPLILAVLGIAGTVLRQQSADPAGLLFDYISQAIPPVSREFEQAVRDLFRGFLDESTGLLSIGTLIFIWLATRLIGTLRTALREVFDIQQDRGIIAGKLFDIKMVVLAGTLFSVNVALTVIVEVVTRYGLNVLGLPGVEFPAALYGRAVAFLTLWVMFGLIYRYLPPRRIRWSTAWVAATFAAVFFELMKLGFSWYIANFADYRTVYNNLATLAVLFIWIYWSAVVFILGGEVAQVVAMQRVRKRQKERLG